MTVRHLPPPPRPAVVISWVQMIHRRVRDLPFICPSPPGGQAPVSASGCSVAPGNSRHGQQLAARFRHFRSPSLPFRPRPVGPGCYSPADRRAGPVIVVARALDLFAGPAALTPLVSLRDRRWDYVTARPRTRPDPMPRVLSHRGRACRADLVPVDMFRRPASLPGPSVRRPQ